ncbi:MAG TPA: class I SAM-dependent methyltransferase [Anaeromyxobacteraceae bacterium]|nr:class I SAM-dependent methyltransferase [Anaeromyxobacteraceae bacterium]
MRQPSIAGAPEPALEAVLVSGGREIEVTLTCASRVSLRARFGGAPPKDGAVLDQLVVRGGPHELRLSRCRYQAEGGDRGRLVFLDDVYDARSLVHERRLIDLRRTFENLPAVLGQRDGIQPEFRSWVAELTYDLSVWRRFFDEQDAFLVGEPAEVVDAARTALLRTVGRSFMVFLDGHLARMGELVAGFAREEHERHGFYLRRQAWPYLSASEFLRRSNVKPHGYSGDAEMMQLTYENRFVGESLFAQLMHKHPVESPAAEAVRSRRRFVPRVLREVAERFTARGAGAFRFMSLACGPAWELQDIYRDHADAQRFHGALLDQDPHALAMARESAARIEQAHGAKLQLDWHQDSVRTMLRAPRLDERFGRHHFVYSMGLFDYLTPPVARAVLGRMYELLHPGGELLVGNYHVENPSRLYMEYWADWVLFLRTEATFRALAEGLPGAQVAVEFDSSRCQMFLRVEKPA